MWVELLRRMSDHYSYRVQKGVFIRPALYIFTSVPPVFATDIRNGLGIHETKCLYDWVHTSYNNKITQASYRWNSLIMPGENMEFKNRKGILFVLFVLFRIYNLSKFIRPGNLQCFWLGSGYKHWLASHCRRTTTWLGPKCRTPTPYSSTFSPYSHEWDISQPNRLIKSVSSRTNKSTRSSTKTLLSKCIEAEDEN